MNPRSDVPPVSAPVVLPRSSAPPVLGLALTLVLATSFAAGPAAAASPGVREAPPAEAPAPAPERAAPGTAPDLEQTSRWRRTGRTIGRDFGSLYSVRPLVRIGGALAVGGALANTSADEEIQDWYREDVRSDGTDDFAKSAKALGDTWVAPTFVLLGLAGELAADGPVGSSGSGVVGWVRHTGRAAIIGLPSVYYLQQLTGGNRPSDGVGSDWEPFDGSHGVSGHTFLGAIPFLTIARMSDYRAVDALAILASTLAGWARMNDDQHYLSQIFLGWYAAWEATGAIARSDRQALGENEERAYTVTPLALPDGGGVQVTMSF